MAVVAIIPARYGSTRLPGKPLARIGGKPMIQHVYESASKARGVDRVLVATDDARIEESVRGFGGEVMMTSKDHPSGTDRLAEVARKINADWFVNIQGDLPFIRSNTISRTVTPLRHDRSILMGTASTPIYRQAEWLNPNVVKVVTDAEGFALYFSRAAIPYRRQEIWQSRRREKYVLGKHIWGYRHIGLYVYQREFLLKFSRLKPAVLEQIEGLEQLRALVNGHRIYVANVEDGSVEVDTPEDLKRAERYFKRSGRERKPWQA
jgi:3-deoxy-manno-octulosonate cytidylyltransferase (CMP-KDO synthetase)